MSDATHIDLTELGVVRLFRLPQRDGLAPGEAFPLDQLAAFLGVAQLNAADVQQVWPDDLDGMSVAEFLDTGYGIDAAQLTAQAHVFAAHESTDLLIFVRSSAFTDRPVTLTLSGGLSLLAMFREPGAQVSFDPLPNPDPQAVLQDAPQKKTPSDAAMSGRVATVALLVMALLVVVMIWIAG